MARSQSVVLVLWAGLPNRRAFVFLGAGPCGVFLGELEKTVAQGRIGGVAGEAAATLGLLKKVERLRHRTHSQRGGSPYGALTRPAQRGPCPPSPDCIYLMSGMRATSTPPAT